MPQAPTPVVGRGCVNLRCEGPGLRRTVSVMDTDFVQLMVTERRHTLEAEAANARLARLARATRPARRVRAPRHPRPVGAYAP
ncbi:hypothetical protein GCM10009836_70160 [Pseudonocardia ailaonensis]|uniref:Uncharacterized protein n=2 Tax=Pseudonocardia ailaonensis TaxID=367279 RepID=A0ABN2NNU7_9PSEU